MGRRPDGFHELVSVFQAVSLADRLTVTSHERLILTSVPFPNNLVLRAGLLAQDTVGEDLGGSFVLEKRIPAAAGLGGGSADAAAALLLLKRLWRKPFNVHRLAPHLGSDVPFFLGSATALVEGRGELVSALPSPASQCVALLRPRVELSTAEVFANLRPEEWDSGNTTKTVASLLRRSVPIPQHLLRNSLLGPALRCCAPLGRLRELLLQHGFQPHLSGSGPTMFVFIQSGEDIRKLATLAQRHDADLYQCRTIRGRPVLVRAVVARPNDPDSTSIETARR
ncbi:MAG: 4-(cytidine 5'-diphospho)-2-C-methyl-D-erythritol kinase [Chloroflexi bacterium]|nr:4-(cytidine 5'-diphospho)-2-C-methyl-D-erythritol kinase [Chloroflexota bacterium]